MKRGGTHGRLWPLSEVQRDGAEVTPGIWKRALRSVRVEGCRREDDSGGKESEIRKRKKRKKITRSGKGNEDRRRKRRQKKYEKKTWKGMHKKKEELGK